MNFEDVKPRVLAWEVTSRCPLRCRHCRASASGEAVGNELSTPDCLRIIDGLPPSVRMIIWTGGEPMMRDDILDLLRRASLRGIRNVMAPCGKFVTEDRLREMMAAGLASCSFSVDGADAATHDAFRGVDGAFDMVMNAMAVARRVGVPFQLNCTVSKLNVSQIEGVYDLAGKVGATRLDVFFLVSKGRGVSLRDLRLDPDGRRRALRWCFERNEYGPLPVKITCAPDAPREWEEWKMEKRIVPKSPPPCGCLGGRSFAFLSRDGRLMKCGFVEDNSKNCL